MGPSNDKEAAMANTALNDWRELAQRSGDGLEVTLLWSKSLDRVKVAVADSKTGDDFELEVAGANALSAFYHPFVFAADRGVSYGAADRDYHHLELNA
jgi:hypothetical protein